MNKLSINSSLIFFPLLVCTSLLTQVMLSLVNVGDSVTLYWIVNLLYMLCLLAMAYGFSRAVKCSFATETSLNVAPKLGSVLVLIVVITTLVFGNTVINDYIVKLIRSLGGTIYELSPEMLDGNMVLTVLGVCVVAPVVEEICFRGVLLGGLSGSGSIRAILATGALFALFHANMAQTYHQFVLGCVLALFALVSRSLWVAIIGHVYNNVIVLVLDKLLYSNGFFDTMPILIMVVSLAVAVTVVALYVNKNITALCSNSKQSNKQVVDKSVILPFALAAVVIVVLWVLSGVSL